MFHEAGFGGVSACCSSPLLLPATGKSCSSVQHLQTSSVLCFLLLSPRMSQGTRLTLSSLSVGRAEAPCPLLLPAWATLENQSLQKQSLSCWLHGVGSNKYLGFGNTHGCSKLWPRQRSQSSHSRHAGLSPTEPSQYQPCRRALSHLPKWAGSGPCSWRGSVPPWALEAQPGSGAWTQGCGDARAWGVEMQRHMAQAQDTVMQGHGAAMQAGFTAAHTTWFADHRHLPKNEVLALKWSALRELSWWRLLFWHWCSRRTGRSSGVICWQHIKVSGLITLRRGLLWQSVSVNDGPFPKYWLKPRWQLLGCR